jgi:hypothetical protein
MGEGAKIVTGRGFASLVEHACLSWFELTIV